MRIAHPLELLRNLIERLVPADALEASLAAFANPLLRELQPVFAVVELQHQLRFGADAPLEQRIFVVARDAYQILAMEVILGAAGVEADVAATRDDTVGDHILALLPVGEGRSRSRHHRLRRRCIGKRGPLRFGIPPDHPFEIDGGRAQQEMIIVANLPALARSPCQQFVPRAEADRPRRAHARAGRRLPLGPAVGTQVALHRMVALRVVAHRAVRTGDDALAAAGTAVFQHADHAAHRVFDDGLGVDRTGAHAGRAIAVLAGKRKKGKRRLVEPARPDHLVAKLTGPQPMLLFAGHLAALAAGATLEVDHQRKSHRVTIVQDATR